MVLAEEGLVVVKSAVGGFSGAGGASGIGVAKAYSFDSPGTPGFSVPAGSRAAAVLASFSRSDKR